MRIVLICVDVGQLLPDDLSWFDYMRTQRGYLCLQDAVMKYQRLQNCIEKDRVGRELAISMANVETPID